MPIASHARAALSALLLLGLAAPGCERDGAAPSSQPVTNPSTGASASAPRPAETSTTTPDRDRPGPPPAIVPHEAARRTETFGPDGGPRIPSEPLQEAPR